MTQSTKEHWNTIYQNKAPNEVSWFQESPTISLALIEKAAVDKTVSIIDIGGGDSLLVDHLLAEGYTNITVLDISKIAIAKAKERLGHNAHKVQWVVTDILDFKPKNHFDIWHDRAAFHFLTSEKAITKYIHNIKEFVTTKGSVILGTFSKTGPEKCSGISITQYSENSLTALLEPSFKKKSCININHQTPFETSQNFIFCTFQKL